MDIPRIKTARRGEARFSENKLTLRTSEVHLSCLQLVWSSNAYLQSSLEVELRLRGFIELCLSSLPLLMLIFALTSTRLLTLRTVHALFVILPTLPLSYECL